MPVLINLIGFFWFWLVLVFAAFYDLVGAALALFGFWVALHFFYSRCRAADLRVAVAAALLGPLVDVLLLQGQWISYMPAATDRTYPPIWMAALWINFALMLNHSLSWMHGRRATAMVMGAISGPLAYLAGDALGGVSLGGPLWIPLLIVTFGWALVWPVLESLTVPRMSSRALEGRAAN